MEKIDRQFQIIQRELRFEPIRASGPGGQNVNKVSTAIQLRFSILDSALPEDVKARLIRLAGHRVNEVGVLIIEAKRHRTQEKNRQDAIERLYDLIERAFIKTKPRNETRPTSASKEKRLRSKKLKGEIKRKRSFSRDDIV